jgi:hypothetical protein
MEGSAMQRFEFDGDTIDVQKSGEDVFVSVRRVCEALGIAHQRQQEKLSEKEWAVVTLMVSTGADGKSYQMTMLHLDSLPLWLATIDAGRVAEDARPKLLRYQRECARVLADHFLGRRSQSPHLRGSTKASLPALLRAIKERVFTPDEVRATFGLDPLPPASQSPLHRGSPLDLDKAIAELDLVDGCTIAEVIAKLGLTNTRSNQTRVGSALKRAGWFKRRARSGVTRPYQIFLSPINARRQGLSDPEDLN